MFLSKDNLMFKSMKSSDRQSNLAIYCALIVLSLLTLPSCQPLQTVSEAQEEKRDLLSESPWAEPDAVVAEVNGKTITQADYYRLVMKKYGTWTVLSGIVKEELFLQKANELGITVDENIVKARVRDRLLKEAQLLGGSNGEDPMKELEKLFKEQRLNLQEVERDMAETVRPQLLIGEVVKHLRVIDDKLLREAYQQTYAGRQYRLSHIAYGYGKDPSRRVEAFERAVHSVGRLRSDKIEFATLAKNESEDGLTALRGGDMGFLPRDQLEKQHPKVKEAILKLKVGEISDPVDFDPQGSIHIFKLTEVLDPKNFDEVREELEKQLRSREPTLEEIQATLKQLEVGAKVKVFGFNRGTAGS